MFPTRVSLILLVSALGGCAGMSEQACLVSDWRSVGFEDGTAGRSVGTISSYRQACSKHGVSPDLESYRAGHEEGVEIYCRPGQGFEVGRRGGIYQGVCPVDLEQDFVLAYNSGRHLFELESAVRQVDNRIESNSRAQENIKRQLTSLAASMASSETTAEQRVLLVGEAAELGRRHGELSAENETLREERVLHELELQSYRQTLASEF